MVNTNAIKRFCFFIPYLLYTHLLFSQEAFEIQVYASNTMPKKSMIIELHSNISPKGPKANPDYRPLHETLEVTVGLADNFELGFYVITGVWNGKPEYIGNNIRPRVMAPSKWKLPVGLSLSMEFGYERQPGTKDVYWGMEIRPIIDKTAGRWYFGFNPNFERVFISGSFFEFTPNFKTYYLVRPVIGLGFEYYCNVGKLTDWWTPAQQYHQLFGAIDLFVDPRLEFNLGVGRGLTDISEQWNVKLLLGWRIKWK
jgi:hypothetical protein